MNYPSQEPQSRVKLLARKAKRALRQKNLVALEKSLRSVNARSDRERINILGPYRNRDKWRVVLIDGKERKSVCASSQEAARALIAKCRHETEQLSSQTIETSLQSYRTHLLGARHVLPSTAEQRWRGRRQGGSRFVLGGWHPDDWLTAAACQRHRWSTGFKCGLRLGSQNNLIFDR